MEQSINIIIADRSYPLKVTSPEHEELIRKAADDINRKLRMYLDKFPSKTTVEIISLVALNLGIANLSLQDNLKSLVEAEEGLVKELEGYLKNNEEHSR